MRLLIVEDEKRLREVLVKHLKKNNYSVDACATGEEAKEFLAMADYDVAILDVMLPGISGFDVLKWARGQKMEVPVLFLTAKSQESDMTMGFSAGGDDYLVKPFSYNELINRVKAMLRRYTIYGAKATEQTRLIRCCGNIEIDPDQCLVRQDGKEIPLTDIEYRTLHLLASHPRKIFSAKLSP